MIRQISIFILILSLSLAAPSAELIQFGESIRAFGMGGVRIPDEEDASSFMWNPANLNFQKGVNFQFFDLGLGLNGLQAYQDFKNVKIESSADLINLYGKHLWIGGEAHTAFAMPHFGVAAFGSGYVDFLLHNPAYPTLDMTYVNDMGGLVGFSANLGPGLGFGLNFKKITRTGGPQKIGPSLLNSATLSQQELLDQFQNKGTAFGIDGGLMLKLPVPLKPTLHLAWQDLGSTAFTKIGGTTAPDRIKDNLTLGASVQADLLLVGFAGGIEYRHITDSTEQLGKKIHLGAEISLLNMDFRAGFYQGYTSYGVGLDLLLFQLDATMYSVERGAYPGQTPDQRILAGLSASFGFDADFNLVDSGGRKRRLKQRR